MTAVSGDTQAPAKQIYSGSLRTPFSTRIPTHTDLDPTVLGRRDDRNITIFHLSGTCAVLDDQLVCVPLRLWRDPGGGSRSMCQTCYSPLSVRNDMARLDTQSTLPAKLDSKIKRVSRSPRHKTRDLHRLDTSVIPETGFLIDPFAKNMPCTL